jgi:hypothetical protein
MTMRSPTVHPLDLGVVAAGVVTVVFSFRGYYTVSAGYVSDSTGAWHGFFGWFGVVLAAAGAAVVAAVLALPRTRFPVAPHPVALALFALGAVSTAVALTTTGYDTARRLPGVPVESGHGYGYWVCLTAIVAAAAMTAARITRIGWSEVWLRPTGGTLGFEAEAPASTPAAPTDQRGELR